MHCCSFTQPCSALLSLAQLAEFFFQKCFSGSVGLKVFSVLLLAAKEQIPKVSLKMVMVKTDESFSEKAEATVIYVVKIPILKLKF